MSGIAGIIHFDGQPAELSLLLSMTSSMRHRGPDGIHHLVRSNVALGHCMLQTTPQSLEERQPLANEDGSLVLVADVRLDNWQELRAELLRKGARLRSRADAELVLQAYVMWGRDCLDHIEGDFAFVIWDERRRQAFCARDRFGQKPFIYHFDGRTLSFASEVRPVLDLPWVSMAFNEGLAAEFLAFEWHTQDETFWKDVKKLPQSMRLIVSTDGARRDVYWRLDAKPRKLGDAEYVEGYRELLMDAVRRCSRSHRPIAVDVSGGLDSTALYSIAEHLRRERRLLAPSLQGYTLNFEAERCASPDVYANANRDLPYARAAADFLGLQLLEARPKIVPLQWYRDHAVQTATLPGYPNGVMTLKLMEQAAGQGSRVSISGVGGDEFLDPAKEWYADYLRAGRIGELLAMIWDDAGDEGLLRALKLAMRNAVLMRLPEGTRSIVLGLLVKARLMERRKNADWLTAELKTKLAARRHSSAMNEYPAGFARTAFDPCNAHERELYEGLAASQGLEVRRPFFNTQLVSFLAEVPMRLMAKGSRTKRLHRAAMRGLLPDSIVERSDKAEFSIACESCLRSPVPAELRAELAAAARQWTTKEIQHRDCPLADWAQGINQFQLWDLMGTGFLQAVKKGVEPVPGVQQQ